VYQFGLQPRKQIENEDFAALFVAASMILGITIRNINPVWRTKYMTRKRLM
jgi:hypothetical protein